MSKRQTLGRSASAAIMTGIVMALSACGGGGDDGTANAVSTEASTEATAAEESGGKLQVLGASDGFVAATLASKLPAGSDDHYDVLVVGRDKLADDTSYAQIERALAGGKTIVLDEADGDAGAARAEVLSRLVGASVSADAVMVSKSSEGGYVLTPVDRPATAARASALSAARNAITESAETSATLNTIENILGL